MGDMIKSDKKDVSMKGDNKGAKGKDGKFRNK